MKALVTGGGGFLGRYIVERLVARGDEVTSLARGDQPALRGMGVGTIMADITDRGAVIAACEGMDAVFHVAARVGIWGPWEEFYSVNVMGTRNVIDGCRAHGASRLVFTSSPSVVFDGEDEEGIDESSPYPHRYFAFYPHTKAMAEQEVLAANGKDGLYTCALRPHLVWGPRDTNLIPRLMERAKAGKLKMVGAGKNMIDTVYVENAAAAHILAVDRLAPGSPVAGSAYFITQGTPVNCWDWINEILGRLGLPQVTGGISYGSAYAVGAAMEAMYRVFGIRNEPLMTRFLAMQLSMSHYFSIGKAERELGYTPAVSMEEGMDRLIESLR